MVDLRIVQIGIYDVFAVPVYFIISGGQKSMFILPFLSALLPVICPLADWKARIWGVVLMGWLCDLLSSKFLWHFGHTPAPRYTFLDGIRFEPAIITEYIISVAS